ncbi:unnamed protein product [Leptidea sinapis]|uniref:AD domain-containing protein n=1 Tax=Leptidea sinapis TaxID=189913 RepID=A0A5E4R5J4_9NEOP|nr:unnamed protein product [Leptidea sinapis]
MESTGENNISNHEKLTEDPEFLLTLIDKFAKIEVLKNIEHCGYIEAIDPVDLSVILNILKEGSWKTVLIPGHAVLNITELEEAPYPRPVKKQVEETKVNVAERREKVKTWFQKNLMPVVDSDDNLALGNTLILPPYDLTSICTDNPMVASQVMNILMKMPE